MRTVCVFEISFLVHLYCRFWNASAWECLLTYAPFLGISIQWIRANSLLRFLRLSQRQKRALYVFFFLNFLIHLKIFREESTLRHWRKSRRLFLLLLQEIVWIIWFWSILTAEFLIPRITTRELWDIVWESEALSLSLFTIFGKPYFSRRIIFILFSTHRIGWLSRMQVHQKKVLLIISFHGFRYQWLFEAIVEGWNVHGKISFGMFANHWLRIHKSIDALLKVYLDGSSNTNWE